MNDQINNNNDPQNVNEQPDGHNEYSDEEYEKRRLEIEKRRAERRAADHRRVMRNRVIALAALLLIIIISVKACGGKSDNSNAPSASSSQSDSVKQAEAKSTTTKKKASDSSKATPEKAEHKIEQSNGMTFVDGILIVNKTYSLPSDYAPGVSTVAQNAFDDMAAAAAEDGITLFVNSSYRSYQDQESLYNSYAWERGTEAADEVSSRPGHSEHQTGLTFDVNTTENSFAGTPEANWLAEHCAEYGFIIRYPEGKEDKTGYMYEPWHIRYLGKEKAEAVTKSGLCLEEYLGVTSDYKYAEDQNSSSLNGSDTQTDQQGGYTADNYYQDNTYYNY